MSYVHIFDVSTGIALVFAFIGISRAFIASVVFSRIGPAVAGQREAGRGFFWTGCTGLTGFEGVRVLIGWEGLAQRRGGAEGGWERGLFFGRDVQD